MTDPTQHPDSNAAIGNDIGVSSDLDSNAGTPHWVKVFGLVALVLVLLFVILMLTGHSPGRHIH